MSKIVVCPGCQLTIDVSEEAYGCKLTCPSCRENFVADQCVAISKSDRDARSFSGRSNYSYADLGYARERVAGPGMALLVIGIVQCIFSILTLLGILILSIVIFLIGQSQGDNIVILIFLLVYSAGPILCLIVSILFIKTSSSMRNLESYGWAVTVSILATVSIFLPIGIWSLVVLRDPKVRQSFR